MQEPVRQPVVVLVTGPDRATLVSIGRTLVNEHLIACINVLEGMTSIYRWCDEVREEDEVLGIIKTTTEHVEELKARIEELHPYEVPEMLVLSVVDGLAEYLDWVHEAVT
tara:strand:+ start:63 stop:392 length:330 start_codon:yes stop_codon:yes gene_type:complete